MQPDITRYSTKFRIYKENGSSSSPVKPIRRNRESLVCNQCRRSKLRCDRKQPCDTCLKRGSSQSCSYEKPVPDDGTKSSASVAEDRILRLEALVKQLIQSSDADNNDTGTGLSAREKRQDFSNVPESVDSSEDKSQEVLDGTNGNITYVGVTHWSSVLDDIHEIKLAITESINKSRIGEDEESNNMLDHNELQQYQDLDSEIIFGSLFGESSVAHIIEQHLPPRTEVDRLLSIYFNGETYIIPFIHSTNFQRQYVEFWDDDPTSVTSPKNPLWVSILFSICYMASVIGGVSGSYKSSLNDAVTGDPSLYKGAGRCLVLGKYYKPQRYAVEALAIYGFSKNLQSLDPCEEAGTIFSMVVRLAYQLGYHRDPDSFGSFSPFEGEMRRRCWAAIKQMDLMISFQLGLPSNIFHENCDTRSPRNLLDSDFDADFTSLPKSRPENEATPLLWFIVKDRLTLGFSKAWREVLSFSNKSDADVEQLDSDLRQYHASIPEVLRARPISASITDSPFLIVTRLYMEFIFLKSICVLHRKYMARGRARSIYACVEAANQIIGRFIDIYLEFRPGGQLQGERWMLTNFTVNDFCLGATILCLFVYLCRKRGHSFVANAPISEADALQALQKALDICLDKFKASKDAQKVAQAIRLTLQTTDEVGTTNNLGSNISITEPNNAVIDNSVNGQYLFADRSEASSGPGANQTQEEAFGLLDPFSFMGNDFDTFNWGEFDATMAEYDVNRTDFIHP